MITSEATPFAQTGGLGEVLSALPAELAKLGLHVDVFMPKYRGITSDIYPIEKTDLAIELTLNAKKVRPKFGGLRPDRRAAICSWNVMSTTTGSISMVRPKKITMITLSVSSFSRGPR